MHAERNSTMFASRTAGLPLNSSRKKLESDMMIDDDDVMTRGDECGRARARRTATVRASRRDVDVDDDDDDDDDFGRILLDDVARARGRRHRRDDA